MASGHIAARAEQGLKHLAGGLPAEALNAAGEARHLRPRGARWDTGGRPGAGAERAAAGPPVRGRVADPRIRAVPLGPPTAETPAKPTSPTRSVSFRPSRSASLPPSNSRLPNANAYAVTTHCRSTSVKCSDRWIVGSAMLITVRSR